ncbi:unnamed protein product [Phyllotreta striolata]|uniref:Extracellular protein n=1 Tax=Phyllotreta striolata TaxID=444603 RepID=A0A9N9TJF5_PHYSR|nr:unnamed protein product [Phyllotreta striolata]
MSKMWVILPAALLPLLVASTRPDCSRTDYDKCIEIADPLVKEAHLVFPDNINDIDQVCATWNRFVDCLKRYTDDCFTDQQKRLFNRAVESPIESVHEMCTNPGYQIEYLKYAPCIKSTIVQRIHCGPQYSLLVDQVDQGDIISKSTLCCSHDRFKQCVQRETRRLCDLGKPDGAATKFATQIIDKALRFLQEQCLNYIPNSGDCQLQVDPHSGRSDALGITTWGAETEGVFPSASPSGGPSTNPWGSTGFFKNRADAASVSPSGDFLGARSRPGSYGRASWSDSSAGQALGSNTVQMYPEVSSTKSTRPEWSSSSSAGWDGRLQSTSPSVIGSTRGSVRSFSSSGMPVEVTSETWYPAAGNPMSNEVDAPNKLGLQKPKNSGISLGSPGGVCYIIMLVINVVVVRY